MRGRNPQGQLPLIADPKLTETDKTKDITVYQVFLCIPGYD